MRPRLLYDMSLTLSKTSSNFCEFHRLHPNLSMANRKSDRARCSVRSRGSVSFTIAPYTYRWYTGLVCKPAERLLREPHWVTLRSAKRRDRLIGPPKWWRREGAHSSTYCRTYSTYNTIIDLLLRVQFNGRSARRSRRDTERRGTSCEGVVCYGTAGSTKLDVGFTLGPARGGGLGGDRSPSWNAAPTRRVILEKSRSHGDIYLGSAIESMREICTERDNFGQFFSKFENPFSKYPVAKHLSLTPRSKSAGKCTWGRKWWLEVYLTASSLHQYFL